MQELDVLTRRRATMKKIADRFIQVDFTRVNLNEDEDEDEEKEAMVVF